MVQSAFMPPFTYIASIKSDAHTLFRVTFVGPVGTELGTGSRFHTFPDTAARLLQRSKDRNAPIDWLGKRTYIQ
jgi:hypothetical protein